MLIHVKAYCVRSYLRRKPEQEKPKPGEQLKLKFDMNKHKLAGRFNNKAFAEKAEKELKDAGKKAFIIPFTYKKGADKGKEGYLVAVEK